MNPKTGVLILMVGGLCACNEPSSEGKASGRPEASTQQSSLDMPSPRPLRLPFSGSNSSEDVLTAAIAPLVRGSTINPSRKSYSLAGDERSAVEDSEISAHFSASSAGMPKVVTVSKLDQDTDGKNPCGADGTHGSKTSFRLKGGSSLDSCNDPYFVSPHPEDIGKLACAECRGKRVCGVVGDAGPSYAEASTAVHLGCGHNVVLKTDTALNDNVRILVFPQKLESDLTRKEFDAKIKGFQDSIAAIGKSPTTQTASAKPSYEM